MRQRNRRRRRADQLAQFPVYLFFAGRYTGISGRTDATSCFKFFNIQVQPSGYHRVKAMGPRSSAGFCQSNWSGFVQLTPYPPAKEAGIWNVGWGRDCGL